MGPEKLTFITDKTGSGGCGLVRGDDRLPNAESQDWADSPLGHKEG